MFEVTPNKVVLEPQQNQTVRYMYIRIYITQHEECARFLDIPDINLDSGYLNIVLLQRQIANYNMLQHVG